MPLPVVLVGGETVKKDVRRKNGCLPPHTSKMLLVGDTGSGKTAMLFTIACHSSIDFINVNAKNVTNKQYTALRAMYERNGVKSYWTDTYLPKFDKEGKQIAGFLPINSKKFGKGRQIFTIFDDLQNLSQKQKAGILDFWSSNRHVGADEDANGGSSVAYLAQDVIAIPKNMRDRADFWFLFGGIPDDRLEIVFKSCGAGRYMKLHEFIDCYHRCTKDWKILHGCFTINKNGNNLHDMFRCQLDKPLVRINVDPSEKGILVQNEKKTKRIPIPKEEPMVKKHHHSPRSATLKPILKSSQNRVPFVHTRHVRGGIIKPPQVTARAPVASSRSPPETESESEESEEESDSEEDFSDEESGSSYTDSGSETEYSEESDYSDSDQE